MEVPIERLTTTEAAVAAGVSLPQVNRVIEMRRYCPTTGTARRQRAPCVRTPAY
jgi:hypothetical protein